MAKGIQVFCIQEGFLFKVKYQFGNRYFCTISVKYKFGALSQLVIFLSEQYIYYSIAYMA